MKPTIFFAIPCGGFYAEQRTIIDEVCKEADVRPNIVEDDEQSKPLWSKVVEGIEESDFFVADISSLRPNIIVELGYALKAKHTTRVAFFKSKNVDVPADLKGMYYHEYSGFYGFRQELISWLQKVVGIDKTRFTTLATGFEFEERFDDRDRFLRWWNTPAGCQYSLTSEGLRLANAYYPILSNTLGILDDYEFTFKAKIEREAIGWVVKGTVDYRINFPIFGVMFNLSDKGIFKPHILCISTPDAKLDYYPTRPIEPSIDEDM